MPYRPYTYTLQSICHDMTQIQKEGLWAGLQTAEGPRPSTRNLVAAQIQMEGVQERRFLQSELYLAVINSCYSGDLHQYMWRHGLEDLIEDTDAVSASIMKCVHGSPTW